MYYAFLSDVVSFFDGCAFLADVACFCLIIMLFRLMLIGFVDSYAFLADVVCFCLMVAPF